MVKIQHQKNRYSITIPKAIVKALDLEKGDELEVKIQDGKIQLEEQ